MSDRVLKPPFTVTLISEGTLSVFKEKDYGVAADTAHAFYEDAKSEKVYVQIRDAEKVVWSIDRGMKKEEAVK